MTCTLSRPRRSGCGRTDRRTGMRTISGRG
jgi:hypothetical protein